MGYDMMHCMAFFFFGSLSRKALGRIERGKGEKGDVSRYCNT